MDTILFDWDGTLIDTAQASFDAFQKSLRDVGIEIDFGLYERIYSPDWRAMFRSVRLPPERWLETEDLWLRHYGQEIPEMLPGARQTLMGFTRAGYNLGIVTSGSRSRVRRELSSLGLAGAFQVVVCSEDVVNRKPHPEGLETAMSRIRKLREFCCYVGDSPEDVEMSKRAGIRAIGILSQYPNSKKILHSDPDLVLESISDLLPHFDIPIAPAARL